jgi:hypothetical protein
MIGTMPPRLTHLAITIFDGGQFIAVEDLGGNLAHAIQYDGSASSPDRGSRGRRER